MARRTLDLNNRSNGQGQFQQLSVWSLLQPDVQWDTTRKPEVDTKASLKLVFDLMLQYRPKMTTNCKWRTYHSHYSTLFQILQHTSLQNSDCFYWIFSGSFFHWRGALCELVWHQKNISSTYLMNDLATLTRPNLSKQSHEQCLCHWRIKVSDIPAENTSICELYRLWKFEHFTRSVRCVYGRINQKVQ